jgi:hypothetical protein
MTEDDADTGPDRLQNYPILTFFAAFGSDTHLNLRFKSMPNTPPSGRVGLGKEFQSAVFAKNVTFTATDPNGNTSESSSQMGQLQNISTRRRVQTGDNVLMGGFIISGTDPKKVMVRGIARRWLGSEFPSRWPIRPWKCDPDERPPFAEAMSEQAWRRSGEITEIEPEASA